MKKHLLRIKVNNKPILKIIKHQNRDFIIAFPCFFVGPFNICFHCTLHTKDDIFTLKITSIKDNNKKLIDNNFLRLIKESSFKNKVLPRGEINLYATGGKRGKKIRDGKIDCLAVLALNLKGKSIYDFVKKESKTPDSSFKKIENIKTPTKKDAINIKIYIGKNYSGSLPLFKKNGYTKLEESNNRGRKYIFLFVFDYYFPKIRN